MLTAAGGELFAAFHKVSQLRQRAVDVADGADKTAGSSADFRPAAAK